MKAYLLSAGGVTNTALAGGITGDKLTSYKVQRQNDTTNTTLTGARIETGWGWILGTGGVSYAGENISFSTPFTVAPIVICSNVGSRLTTNPTLISDLTSPADMIIETSAVATGGFRLDMETRAANNTDVNKRYGYSWIAIGA